MRLRAGYGLIAVYLVLVNALVHLAAALVLRRYNPGLWTALFGFLPLGAWALAELQRTHPSVGDHVLALPLSAAIHVGIVLPVKLAENSQNQRG